jgi:hypothetical protein
MRENYILAKNQPRDDETVLEVVYNFEITNLSVLQTLTN